MDDNLNRRYRRWHAAEGAGRDEEADAEFQAVFGAVVPQQGVSAGFTARTMEAVAAAATRELVRTRRLRAGMIAAGIAGAVLAAYFGAGLTVRLGSGLVARTFDLLIGLVVKMAGAAQTGADVWSMLSSVGQAAAAVAGNPTVTAMLFALQAIALIALFALQRLLGADEESLK